ncbi:allantoicase-like [Tubulanus polymorphus]|uniref:allantoicase-like n=1 Tax=Tubulanus polymorphus TaxID=672921 RepID=UPI003DA2F585
METKAPKFTELNDLANERNGGKIIFSTDDWFAVAENLLKPSEPEWREGEFTEFGKWMDGWETRRKRIPGHDWCIIQLGRPGVISGIDIDTCYFTGNFAPRASVQAINLDSDIPQRVSKIGTAADSEQFEEVDKLKSENWKTIVPMTKLRPGYLSTRHNYIPIENEERWTHLRLNMFPDGGIARFRVYGHVKLDWSKISSDKMIDLAAMENGGVCVGYSNTHYGHARNIIAPGRGVNMGDGWETARRLDRPAILEADDSGILQVPGSEYAIFRLGHPGIISNIEIDTNHFKGNFPDSCKIEACFVNQANEKNELDLSSSNQNQKAWKILLPPQKLSPHKRHYYKGLDMVRNCGVVSHIRITMAPDGGISRMRLRGIKQLPIVAKL